MQMMDLHSAASSITPRPPLYPNNPCLLCSTSALLYACCSYNTRKKSKLTHAGNTITKRTVRKHMPPPPFYINLKEQCIKVSYILCLACVLLSFDAENCFPNSGAALRSNCDSLKNVKTQWFVKWFSPFIKINT